LNLLGSTVTIHQDVDKDVKDRIVVVAGNGQQPQIASVTGIQPLKALREKGLVHPEREEKKNTKGG